MSPSLKHMAPRALLLLVCVMALASGIIIWRLAPSLHPATLPTYMELDGKRFTLEIAMTDAERKKGLGGQESLCRTCAMLFVFDEPGKYAFWMKDMRFPLDIVWLLGDTVAYVAREVSPFSSEIFDPAVTANRVVELTSGAAKNVEVGEKLQFFY